MKRLLISCLDPRLDFNYVNSEGGLIDAMMVPKRDEYLCEVNMSGPNMSFHAFHFDPAERGNPALAAYDQHLLLWWGKAKERYPSIFLEKLAKQFPKHATEIHALNINNPTDLAEVKAKMEDIIRNKVKNHQLDIFIGPGFLLLQYALFILYHELRTKHTIRLLQNIRKEFTQQLPELVECRPEPSFVSQGMNYLGQSLSQEAVPATICLIPSVEKQHREAQQIAYAHKYAVLILGESGTGKEHLARLIHDCSPRKAKAFKAINIGSYSHMADSNLLRSELFGHEKGAFSGAETTKKGLFEEADGGTLFFDEIGEISPDIQVMLLRVLQEGTFQRVGGTKELKADVRIVAATHKNLPKACEEGAFRWDLYYRLNIARLQTCPWRELPEQERLEFIDWELDHTQQALHKEMDLQIHLSLSPKAKKLLACQRFPGNFRQVSSFIKRLFVSSLDPNQQEQFIDEKSIQQLLRDEFGLDNNSLDLSLKEAERKHIQEVLQLKNGHLSKTSKTLGIALNTLKDKIKKYGIEK